MAKQIPFVDYLVLEPEPHLIANVCTSCGATYFGRRNACAACEGDQFTKQPLSTEGELRAFTIVTFAAPGVPVPFVAGIFDCGGTQVKGNLVNVEPTPAHVSVGMKVKLTTVPVGTDSEGTEAINYGFEPVG